MSAYRRLPPAAAVAASLLAFAPAPANAACSDDLAANHKRFEDTIARLESVKNGTQAEKCAAYRSHVRIMQRAIPIFDRCTSGLGRRENIGQMNDSIEDFVEIIRRNCTR
jgi:hypothetical protein